MPRPGQNYLEVFKLIASCKLEKIEFKYEGEFLLVFLGGVRPRLCIMITLCVCVCVCMFVCLFVCLFVCVCVWKMNSSLSSRDTVLVIKDD